MVFAGLSENSEYLKEREKRGIIVCLLIPVANPGINKQSDNYCNNLNTFGGIWFACASIAVADWDMI